MPINESYWINIVQSSPHVRWLMAKLNYFSWSYLQILEHAFSMAVSAYQGANNSIRISPLLPSCCWLNPIKQSNIYFQTTYSSIYIEPPSKSSCLLVNIPLFHDTKLLVTSHIPTYIPIDIPYPLYPHRFTITARGSTINVPFDIPILS